MHSQEILPGIFALEGEPGYGYRAFSYVVEFADHSVLIDVSDEKYISALSAFKMPRHLILTHRHTRRHEARFEQEFGLSVWLHPSDAQAPRQGPASNTAAANQYHNPLDGGLAHLGFEFFHIPGHTPGCCFVHLQRHGGILFVGDAVVGPKLGEPIGLAKPPAPTSDNDDELRRSLSRFVPPPHRAILPYHGEPVVTKHADEATVYWRNLISL